MSVPAAGSRISAGLKIGMWDLRVLFFIFYTLQRGNVNCAGKRNSNQTQTRARDPLRGKALLGYPQEHAATVPRANRTAYIIMYIKEK